MGHERQELIVMDGRLCCPGCHRVRKAKEEAAMQQGKHQSASDLCGATDTTFTLPPASGEDCRNTEKLNETSA